MYLGGSETKENKKKIFIPIILLLVFIIPVFSGCIYLNNFPVDLLQTEVDYDLLCVILRGEVGVPLCKAKNYSFVYDTVSHENWSDYRFKLYNNYIASGGLFFFNKIDFSNITKGVTYYVRAVAYCYDFKKPFQNYEEGYYQGDEKTFKIY